MIINFIIAWVGIYVLIYLVMALDNINWITSSPEYPIIKKYSWGLFLQWIITYRMKTVLIDRRDIYPAIVGSLAITFFLFKMFFLGVFLLFLGYLVSILIARYGDLRSWNK